MPHRTKQENDIGYDVTRLIQTIVDLNKYQENPMSRDQLKAEIPFLKNAHAGLGELIFMLERDPVDLRQYIQAAE